MDFSRNMINPHDITAPESDRSDGAPACPDSLPRPGLTFKDLVVHAERTYPMATARPMKTALRQIAVALVTVRARATGAYLDPNPKNLDLAGLPFDLVAINETLTGVRFRIAGFTSDKTFRNAMSNLRRIGRDLGLVQLHRAPELPSDHAYVPFLAVADTFQLASARRFVAKMLEDGRHPRDVTSDDLARYGVFLSTQMVGVKIAPMLRRIAELWRRAAERDPAWPRTPLKPPGEAKRVNPLFTAYPMSLQDEIAGIRRRMEGPDRQGPFSPDCDGRPLRPATVKLRLACIRALLGEHVALGNDPRSVTSFRDLLASPETIQRILQSLWERGQVRRRAMPEGERELEGNGITGLLDGVGVTLAMLTRYFPQPPDLETKLQRLIKRVRKSPMSEMTRKNRRRLDQFRDPVKLARLLTLPTELMSEALKLREQRPAEAARLARAAVLFAIELKIPLRMRNLHTCRLGYNLRFDGAGGNTGTMSFQAHEMKNRREIVNFVGERTCKLLKIYIERFLPFFAATSPDQSTKQWLFPAGGGKSGPLSASQISKTINDLVAERVGAEFHPHLFRSLAAEMALKHDRGGHEHLRQLLGDGSLGVVLAHYAPVRDREATEHQDRTAKPTAWRRWRRPSDAALPPEAVRER
jgi:integrase